MEKRPSLSHSQRQLHNDEAADDKEDVDAELRKGLQQFKEEIVGTPIHLPFVAIIDEVPKDDQENAEAPPTIERPDAPPRRSMSPIGALDANLGVDCDHDPRPHRSRRDPLFLPNNFLDSGFRNTFCAIASAQSLLLRKILQAYDIT